MRQLVIVFDSVRYDQFLWTDAPNLKSLGGVHKAYSHGRWTRPSMVSLLSGYLPHCPEIRSPWEPSWAYLNYGEEPRYFFNTSPWCQHLFPLKGTEVIYDPPRQAKVIVEDLIETSFETAIVLFSETHMHYWFGEETEEDKELNKRVWDFNHKPTYSPAEDFDIPVTMKLKQRRAIKYLDEQLKPLLDCFKGKVYFTSDHGELFGEYHRIGHDPSFPYHIKLFEVPLIVGEI
jgi:hypothetical protein